MAILRHFTNLVLPPSHPDAPCALRQEGMDLKNWSLGISMAVFWLHTATTAAVSGLLVCCGRSWGRHLGADLVRSMASDLRAMDSGLQHAQPLNPHGNEACDRDAKFWFVQQVWSLDLRCFRQDSSLHPFGTIQRGRCCHQKQSSIDGVSHYQKQLVKR